MWRLPRRWSVRVSRVAYLSLESSRLRPVLQWPLVQRVKAQMTHMPASHVLEVVDLCASADVQGWVAGGWVLTHCSGGRPVGTETLI